jgi:hypothetical protein
MQLFIFFLFFHYMFRLHAAIFRWLFPLYTVLLHGSRMLQYKILVLFFKYKWNDQGMEDEMARHVARTCEKRNAYRLLVVKPERKRPLGRP